MLYLIQYKIGMRDFWPLDLGSDTWRILELSSALFNTIQDWMRDFWPLDLVGDFFFFFFFFKDFIFGGL